MILFVEQLLLYSVVKIEIARLLCAAFISPVKLISAE
jgi:hypothetical protein